MFFDNDPIAHDEGDALVPRGRHKRARSAPRSRGVARLAVPVALITAAPVGAVVTSNDPADTATTATAEPSRLDAVERAASPSRSMQRSSPLPASTPTVNVTSDETADPEPAEEQTSEPTSEPTAEPSAEPTVDGHMFSTAGLNVRDGASVDAEVVTVVARATELALTGDTDGAWVQVLVDGAAAWVHGDYLSEEEPPPEEEGGVSHEPCPAGTDIEASLTQDAIRVYRAVCARFPSVDSYGGYRSGGGAHGEGRAVDFMVTGATGDQIAAWVRENHSVLGVSAVIWEQQIWTVERSSEGWRWMEDRGSATANHYDHVHVTVYGNAGG